MIFTAFKRIAKTGFVNFWRNGFLSFAAVIVITLTLLALGGIIFAGAFGRSLISQVESQVDINVYFTLSAQGSDILALRSDISKLPEVASTTYISRDQVLAAFKDRWQDNALVMQGLDEVGNPFPAMLNIKATSPGQYGSIDTYIQTKNPVDASGTPIIAKTNYHENQLIIDRLSRIIPTVEQGGLAVALILALVAIIVVWNTIRLIAYTARDEISVMKLVGASNAYVRGPMVVAGIMYGIVSGIIALILLAAVAYWTDWVILRVAGVDIAQNFSFAVDIFSGFFNRHFGEIFSIVMGAGILLGGVSSYIAARRYLRV